MRSSRIPEGVTSFVEPRVMEEVVIARLFECGYRSVTSEVGLLLDLVIWESTFRQKVKTVLFTRWWTFLTSIRRRKEGNGDISELIEVVKGSIFGHSLCSV